MERAQYHIAQLTNTLVHRSVVLSTVGGAEGELIYINPNHLIECSGNVELSMSIRKRFSSKRFRNIKFIADTLVYTCLSSNGYSINHNVLRSIGPDILLYVWEFIQTISVSSSPSLRGMIVRLSRGRTKEGYESTHPCIDHSHQKPKNSPWVSFKEAGQTTWVQLDPPSHNTCSTFFESGLVDRIMSKRIAVEQSEVHIRSLCIDTLHTIQE